MKKAYSEVFENFEKIAIDEGFVEAREIKKEASTDKEASAGALSRLDYSPEYKEKIQALYGVNPDSIYKKDILDEAHPETVVVSTSYDRFNGVVENLKERQNVMIDIALKFPFGTLVNKRYVSSSTDLSQELTRIGFLLESSSSDDKDLAKLADHCNEEIVKNAWYHLIPYVVGVALYTGLVYAWNFAEEDIKRLDAAINETEEKYNDLRKSGGDEIAGEEHWFDKFGDLLAQYKQVYDTYVSSQMSRGLHESEEDAEVAEKSLLNFVRDSKLVSRRFTAFLNLFKKYEETAALTTDPDYLGGSFNWLAPYAQYVVPGFVGTGTYLNNFNRELAALIKSINITAKKVEVGYIAGKQEGRAIEKEKMREEGLEGEDEEDKPNISSIFTDRIKDTIDQDQDKDEFGKLHLAASLLKLKKKNG